MTDPKPKTTPGDAEQGKADAGAVVYVLNNVKSPFVIPGGPTLGPERVTPVPVDIWKTFSETTFCQALIEDGSIEESDEATAKGQPQSEQEQADEADQAEQRTPKKKGKK